MENSIDIKSTLQPGKTVRIGIPGKNMTEKAIIEMLENQHLWVSGFPEGDRNRGTFLTVRFSVGSNSYSFKAMIAGRKIEGKDHMTELIAFTEPTDDNRREAFRLQKLFDLTICRKFEDDVEGKSITCQGLDISDTGIGFATTRWFDYGDMIECKFSLGDARYQLTAKVVRILRQQADERDEIYRIGARFNRIGDNIRKRIRRYIYLQQTAQRRRMNQEKHE